MNDSFLLRRIIQNSHCSGDGLSLWVSRFPTRRESRLQDKPPQAERLIPRAAAQLFCSWKSTAGEAFAAEDVFTRS